MITKKFLSLFLSFLVVIFWAGALFAVELVSVDWLKSKLGDPNIVIVDVQNKPESYAKGHIPGALPVNRYADLADITKHPPFKYPNTEQFINLMARLGIDNNAVIVAYDDTNGLFASRFLFIMELYGHDPKKLKLLNGGLLAWKKSGYPITTEPATPKVAKPYKTKGPNKELLITWSDIYKDVILKDAKDIVLVDARPADEFTGKRIRAIRGGHIPGAINVTSVVAANNKEDHTFKSPEEIRKAYIEAGVTPDKIVYTYCHSGDRVAHTYIILKHFLGYKNVKVYDGNWIEWANLTALPAENEVWLPQQVK